MSMIARLALRLSRSLRRFADWLDPEAMSKEPDTTLFDDMRNNDFNDDTSLAARFWGDR